MGGVSVRASSADAELLRCAALRKFASARASEAQLDLAVRWVPKLESPSAAPDFDSGGVWRLYRQGRSLGFDFQSSILGSRPYKRALVDESLSHGEILVSRECFPGAPPNALEYPLDEVLVLHKLAKLDGLELHACGVIDASGTARLFVGHSGDGKSTLSRLWAQRPGVSILSDDRIIVRHQDRRLWMYGTPWHGDAGFANPLRTQLGAIFILAHGRENQITPLAAAPAAAQLFARSFPVFHDGDALASHAALLSDVVASVPCYRFSFLPETSCIEMVLTCC